MSEKSYYLSIQSTSLAHYIGKALILPSRFYKNRPSDIQNIESDYLILSPKKFLNDSNCAIEIILNKEEVENLEESHNKDLIFYKYPLAISRIKKIFFLDEIQKLKTIDSIQRGTGFIPQQLVEIIDEEKVSIEIKVDNYKYIKELEDKVKTYNNILGGLAFVRYVQQSQYSENYFSILSYFNNLIEEDYKKANFKIENKYNGAFSGDGKFWKQLYPLLYEDISEQDVSTFSQKENIELKRLNGILDYETIKDNSITYKLAILSIYGEESTKRKKTNDLILDYKNEKILKNKQEGIALIYGINNGYSTFRNQYENKIVKFKMDSLLDYYTVESVFQYVINNKRYNKRFEYIDAIGIEKDIVLNKKYETYTVLDETIIRSDKKTIISRIEEWIKEKYFSELDTYIDNLSEKIKNLISEKKELVNSNIELKKELNIKNNKIENLKNSNVELPKKIEEKFENQDNKQEVFDENRKKIIIEKTLELYDKKLPELKKIAKEKGIKSTKKRELIKDILCHKDSTLFE